jgi:hypothetical protein
MPPNRGDLGTLIHAVVLAEMSRRLTLLGVPNATEVKTKPDGSKNLSSTHEGRVDLALVLPDVKKKGEARAELYELKPRVPSKYQDYVSEVEHYAEHFPEKITDSATATPGVQAETITDARVGSALQIAEKAAPQLFDPIVIKNESFEVQINISLAKDNNGATIPGLIVYDLGIRARRPGESNSVEAVKNMLHISINQNAEAQIVGIARWRNMLMITTVPAATGFVVGPALGALESGGAVGVAATATTATTTTAVVAAGTGAGTGATVISIGAGAKTAVTAAPVIAEAAALLLYLGRMQQQNQQQNRQ